jgi:hypothetical protein
VVSRPDARLYKARIAIQISRSGRQPALVRTSMQLIWKLPIRLQPSGRLPFMVRTRAYLIWKLRVEVQPSGRSFPMVQTHEALYGSNLQQTCDRSDVSVSPSGRGSQTGKIFSGIFRKSCRIVVHPDGQGSPSRRRPYILQQLPILHLSL